MSPIKENIKSNKYLYNIASKLYSEYNKFKSKRVVKIKCSYIKDNDKPKFIILLQDKYGNIGDVALRFVHRCFLEEYFPDNQQLLLSKEEYWSSKSLLRKFINEKDIIMLVGGGNTGNQYMEIENARRDIINTFTKNPIICFPQSIYYTPDEHGQKEKVITSNIINEHKNITIIARDRKSLEIAENLFPLANLFLTPDMVLWFNKTEPKVKRNGVLTLLRSDVEKVIDDKTQLIIEKIVHKHFENIISSDTLVNYGVEIKDQKMEFEKKLDDLKSAELVVTDRLHGMIFAAITSTPCIVLPNYNHKIKYQYEWIKHLNYIVFLDDLNNLENEIIKFKKLEVEDYDNGLLLEEYGLIINKIEEELKKQ